MVTAPTQLLIHGKKPGTISLFVWDRAGGIKTYEVDRPPRPDAARPSSSSSCSPASPSRVLGSGKDVVLSGTVSSKYVIDKAADVAAGYVEKKENVVNLLKQQEGVASNQVMLRVRFAEVSRSAMQELGATVLRQRLQGRAGSAAPADPASPRADLRRPTGTSMVVQRLPQPVRLQHQEQRRRRRSRRCRPRDCSRASPSRT